jgi:hypothetical protein
MKTKVTLLLLTAATLCLAQINNDTQVHDIAPLPPYDKKIPPPVNLGTAYNKAVLALGTATKLIPTRQP